MRAFFDPILTEISRKLRDVDFEPDSILDDAADSLEIMHGVQLFPVNKSTPGAPREYAVVLHVAQKQRIIGKTKWRAAACRFADMARLKFFKYRKRNAVEPVDDDLNFSLAQAKSDLQFETGAVALLDEIETHFREKGFWKDKVDKEVRSGKSERRSLAVALREVQSEIEIIKEQLAGLMALAQLQPETFKRGESPVDHGKTENDGQWEVNQKLVNFRVHVPDPLDDAKVHHSVNILVEARIEDGLEILTPEALATIERVRAEELQIIMHQQLGDDEPDVAQCAKEIFTESKQITDPIAELLPTP